MLVLALDTTSRPGSVALLRDGVLLAERAGEPSRPPGQRLPGDIAALLQELALKVADIDLYAVTAGPGSFTGIRVGIATIQGLALANARKVVSVSALEALAFRGPASNVDRVAAWIDAQRGEVFAALYAAAHAGGGAPDPATGLVEVVPPVVGRPGEVLEAWRDRGGLAKTPLLFTGDGATAYRSLIEQALGADARIMDPPACLSSVVGEIATARAACGGALSPHAIVPVYVRRSDAEIAREKHDARR